MHIPYSNLTKCGTGTAVNPWSSWYMSWLLSHNAEW